MEAAGARSEPRSRDVERRPGPGGRESRAVITRSSEKITHRPSGADLPMDRPRADVIAPVPVYDGGSSSASSPSQGQRRRRPGMYDLVLKGGKVLDPSTGLDGVLDIAVQNGLIARIAPEIAPAEATRTIEVRDKLVTPG